MKFLIFLLPVLAAVTADTGYGYEPQIHCRPTHDSIHAQICAPSFTHKSSDPVTLPTKKVVDHYQCYEQVRTVCKEETKVQPKKICTTTYHSKPEAQVVTSTHITYEKKTVANKVTSCKPSGYGDHYGAGEHQYCKEEYVTHSFKVPLVDDSHSHTGYPATPEPVQHCVTKDMHISEVVCHDVKREKCFNVAKFENYHDTVDPTEIVPGKPKCHDITLTLPTQACAKKEY